MQKQAILMVIIVGMLLAGCQNTPAGEPPKAVESYLQALVARDQNAMTAASCANWEANALNEYNSFNAVKLNLQSLACQEAGQDGNYHLVTCTGQIIANYGAEDLQIDVAGRTYQVLQEGGRWRMCGYHD